MNEDQVLIVAILLAAMVAFIWGRWRHDVVALCALLAAVFVGVVPSEDAFGGFGHPAVVTVAAVLILSEGLQASGAVYALTRRVLPRSDRAFVAIAALVGVGAILSAFINNVGALALLMPAGIQLADRLGIPPGKVLMPLAFGSILGGMTTLIGTPPNIIVAEFRESTGMEPFSMFDFTPVGLIVALAGVVFVVGTARWLVPTRQRSGQAAFETGAYLAEARVAAGSKAADLSIGEVNRRLEESNAQILGLFRDDQTVAAPSLFRVLQEDDVLVIEAEPETLGPALAELGLELVGKDEDEATARDEAGGDQSSGHPPRQAIQSDEVRLVELVVLPGSELAGRSAANIQLRSRFNLNLLAVSRREGASFTRLRLTPIEEGDVLLIQGGTESIREFAALFRCAPLAERPVQIPDTKRALTAALVMGAAVAATVAGLLPAAVSFTAGAVAIVLLKVVSISAALRSVDWPVVILLAAMLPLAGAMSSTGTADLIAGALIGATGPSAPLAALMVILVTTMILTDLMNNAATAATMCPIALFAAQELGVNADPFLIAVAIGSACAFLTPIGHQNNTLILGPGGFRFSDYWRLGLPLQILILGVAALAIPVVWPFA